MNLVRDHARKIERRQRLLTTAPVMVSSFASPDEGVERGEQVQSVRVVLDQLSERDQQLLLMREEGFKYEEIAEVIGVAPASVGTLIARALRRFTDLYKAQSRS
jgi:RNA polymerase sigma-70 factor (ECF subfamily)